jgi:molybdate transport system ATP-binding protein
MNKVNTMIRVDITKKLRYFNLNVRFQVNSEVLVIQGPSGSGKTTILDCIAGIKNPDNGEIIFENNLVYSDSQGINLPIMNRNIGYVFQNYALFPHMTIKENIRFGIKSKGNKDFNHADSITDIFKIKHLDNRYPSQISGGEKQRAALARALATKPKLLLLDEPFSALDKDTKEVIYNEFLEFKKLWKMSVILITHDDDEAKLLGDKIVKIRDGFLI